jgi:hypothetical protein
VKFDGRRTHFGPLRRHAPDLQHELRPRAELHWLLGYPFALLRMVVRSLTCPWCSNETVEQVAAIVAAVTPKPVNLLINAPFMTVSKAAAMGVRRISVGGTVARTAWHEFLQASTEIADTGTLLAFEHPPNVEAHFHHH